MVLRYLVLVRITFFTASMRAMMSDSGTFTTDSRMQLRLPSNGLALRNCYAEFTILSVP